MVNMCSMRQLTGLMTTTSVVNMTLPACFPDGWRVWFGTTIGWGLDASDPRVSSLKEAMLSTDTILYNTLFSREEHFAQTEFEIFSREDIFANLLFTRKFLSVKISSRENIFSRKYPLAKISSRENIFPRKYPPAKIVCLFRQRSFLFAVCCPVIGHTGSRPNVRS